MLDAVTRETRGLAPVLQALDRSFAKIVCAADGTILHANSRWLRLFGYEAPEIVGVRYVALVPRDDDAQESFSKLWADLQHGESRHAEECRVGKSGGEVWLAATYAPVLGEEGQLVEVVCLASEITARKLRSAADSGQIAAFDASHAVLHLDVDGTVTHANELFLRCFGYTLAEVAGRHHRMFVDPAYAAGEEYAAFWNGLAAGRRQAGEFQRLGSDGRVVWMQAAYNPIFEGGDAPSRIVVYATDVTRARSRQADHEGQIAAIHKSKGVVTFDMHGIVLKANANFLEAMGYQLHEVQGRHHRMFVDPSYAHGQEYATFWDSLALGGHQAAEYRRFGKDGREVWLQATYNPVFDLDGRPFKVVKYATVVTREKLRQADHQGQIASIHKAQCVVSFTLDESILDANDNFLAITGYRLSDIRGRHHRMFVDPATAGSSEYLAFWSDLAQGRHRAAEFKRLCADGREIWLQASYNPIFDMNGRPFKVVKYATDVTNERLRQADCEGQIAAIRKSQCVISFDMDGTIIDANDNFLRAFGYAHGEIEGRHHRIFVEPEVAETEEYAAFWSKLRDGSFLSSKFKRVGKGGREVWIQASYNPILDLEGRPFKVVKIAADITADVALAAAFREAERQAQHDAITALPNRLSLARFMKSHLERPASRLAVLYLDLDHFKPINDTFGHQVGDRVLVETAIRASFLGLDAATDKVDLAHAVLEGVAFSMLDGCRALESADCPITEPGFIGGGARSAFWGTLIATVLRRPILRYDDADLGPALGAARLGMAAATGAPLADIAHIPTKRTVIEPDTRLQEAYAARHESFRSVYQALKGIA